MSKIRSIRGYLTMLYAVAMLGIFPLVMHERYNDLTKTKFYFFMAATLGAAVGVVILSAALLLKERKAISVVINRWVYGLELSDFFLICFLLVVVGSCLNSDFQSYAILGTKGRYIGMLPLLACGISYFLISRFLPMGKIIFSIMCLAGCIVFILGIGHHFCLDPLGLQKGLDSHNRAIFYSTIGNRNVLSSYLVMVLGLAAGLFCFEKKKGESALYIITVILGFAALFTCDSDSGFLAAALMFYALPFFYRTENFSLMRYLTLLNLFFITAKTVGLFTKVFPVANAKSSFVQNILLNSNLGWAAIAVIAIFQIILWRCRESLTTKKRFQKAFPVIWTVFGILSVILVIGSVVWFSVFDKTADIGQASGYLRFNKDWGSRRGAVWIKAMETFGNFNLSHMLIGKGPDCAALILNPNYFSRLGNTLKTYFDNCHNEYIQYLLTVGILGMVSYIGFLASALSRMLHSRKASPAAIACGISVLCYAGQALVNINQSITTPIVFVMIAVGIRNAKTLK